MYLHGQLIYVQRPLWAQFDNACRFFDNLDDMESETALYKDEVLRSVLPQLLAAQGNQDGRLRSSSGYQWPPYIVLEVRLHTRLFNRLNVS